MRITLGDVFMSLGAVAVLLLTLLAVDHRVRDEISWRMAVGRPSAELRETGGRLHNLGHVVYVAARDQSLDHAPLVTFVVVAAGLVILMLKL